MGMDLVSLHWIYISFILLILGFMIIRRDTTIICIIGIFLLSFTATSSLTGSISGVFSSFIYAITELLPTILIISIIVSMSKALITTGVNDMMISPFARFIKTPTLAYWVIGLVMMIISFFFWPSPAIALLGAVLLPVALRAGLPALGVAMAMNLFGHGIALSGDFVIQAAPKLTADAAGLPVSDVIQASVPLVITMGVVTTVTAFIFLKRDLKNGTLPVQASPLIEAAENTEKVQMPLVLKRILALLIPILFALNVWAMFTFNLQGGDATALIGGTSLFILMIISIIGHQNKGLEKTTSYLIEGFQFGFKVFGPVIPIAAFFYLGDAGFTSIIGDFLPKGSHGIVNDLGVAISSVVPLNEQIAAVTVMTIGAITGLDGSGFSGISLVGSISQLFATAIGSGTATLTALGQVAGIWVGGGTPP
ncbi:MULTISPECIES: hypothetical protein [Priestia]|uniref:hypothetical protein n=1 Tax=Priestia TaxID=2800373 RepID=UPI00119D3CCE|nr:hypothetical protein [Priestia flexa]MED4590730.1 hypothetical protein [Priestia flexa]